MNKKCWKEYEKYFYHYIKTFKRLNLKWFFFLFIVKYPFINMQLCLAKVHPVLFFDVGYYYFFFLFEGKIELRTCLYTLNKKNFPSKF